MRDQELKLEKVETSHNRAGEDGIQGEGSGEEAICIQRVRERAHASARARVCGRETERASERERFICTLSGSIQCCICCIYSISSISSTE
jgi:hypothetical protein